MAAVATFWAGSDDSLVCEMAVEIEVMALARIGCGVGGKKGADQRLVDRRMPEGAGEGWAAIV